ncbi:MAG: preprotein translocase subunit TatC, partial [Puniceicoccaceae bacterium]
MRSHMEENSDQEMFPEDGQDEPALTMSFLDHLEAFRWTIIYCLSAFAGGAILVGVFIGPISRGFQYPLNRAYGSAELASQNLITYSPMGVFSVLIQVVFLGGLLMSLPFIIYMMARFVGPALNERELRVVRPCCVATCLLFVLGVLFSFFLVLPMTLTFSVKINEFFGFDLLWAASDYYSLVVWFSLAMGFFFQFPMVIILLVYLEIVSTTMLRRFRRHVFLGLAIFSALVTPGGDPITLMMMTAPMYGFY